LQILRWRKCKCVFVECLAHWLKQIVVCVVAFGFHLKKIGSEKGNRLWVLVEVRLSQKNTCFKLLWFGQPPNSHLYPLRHLHNTTHTHVCHAHATLYIYNPYNSQTSCIRVHTTFLIFVKDFVSSKDKINL